MAEFRKWSVQPDSSLAAHANKRVPDPPGFDPGAAREGEGSGSLRAGSSKLPLQKRQELLQAQAQAPFKQVAMLCFMMWMSGSTLHIFSIMMTLNGIYQPLSAILKARDLFPADPQGELNTAGPRATFCLLHGAGLAFAIWKVNAMGLLPTNLSDWVSSMRPPTVLEHAAPNLLRG